MAPRISRRRGGGALQHESVAEAAVRETQEETGVRVAPGRVLLVEDVVGSRFKMCKVWLACAVVAGEATTTAGARREGIIEVRWFRRADLDGETIYPWIIREREWRSFSDPRFATEVSPSRLATF